MRASWSVGGSVVTSAPDSPHTQRHHRGELSATPAVVTWAVCRRNATASFAIAVAETAFVACVAIRAICPRCVAAFQPFRLFGSSLAIHLMIAY